jgi:hypothetical protein
MFEVRPTVRQLTRVVVREDRNSVSREPLHLTPMHHSWATAPGDAARYSIVREIDQHLAPIKLLDWISQKESVAVLIYIERTVVLRRAPSKLAASKECGLYASYRELTRSKLGLAPCNLRETQPSRTVRHEPYLLLHALVPDFAIDADRNEARQWKAPGDSKDLLP